jgi:hypothetical protein
MKNTILKPLILTAVIAGILGINPGYDINKKENLESKIVENFSSQNNLPISEQSINEQEEDTSSMGYKFYKEAEKYLGVPYKWNGRSKEKLDCMGLPFKSYTDLTQNDWKKLSVFPKKLVKSGKLGSPVEKLDGILRDSIDYNKLKIGDVVYFLVDYKASNEDFFTKINEKKFWVWHMGIYAGTENGKPKILDAKPGEEVVKEPMKEIYYHAIYVTRFNDEKN